MSKDITGFITWIRSFLDDVYAPKNQSSGITLNDVYPVGSIYMSVNNMSPSALFGGSWTKLEGRFLLGAGDFYISESNYIRFDVNTTGGEMTHTLTESEMPSHTHIQNAHNHMVNNDNNLRFSAGSGGSYDAITNTSGRKNGTRYCKDTTATNKNTGGGQAHNNMPQYLVVNMWKRTA